MTDTVRVRKAARPFSGVGIHVLLITLFLTIGSQAFSQIGLGVRLGGNLSHADAISFRSSNRVGFQVGGVLSYHFHPKMAIQVEPTLNLSRIRANSETIHEANGIDKGNKALYFFDLPVLFRWDIARSFALLGGAAFNTLLNDDKYRLNNGEKAFKGGTKLGYSFGAELGKFYFRYYAVERSANIHRSWSPNIQQYQIGVKWDIF